MAKIFNGKVLFASAMQPTGAQPLDDRVVVQSYSDLVDTTTFGDAKYLGMIVGVVDESKLYMLTNTDVTAEGAWKEIGGGDVSKEDVSTGLAGKVDASAYEEKMEQVDASLAEKADASDVYTKEEANNTFVKSEGYVAYSQEEKNKLAGIEEGAQVNYIKSVGDNLNVDASGNLTVSIPEVEVPFKSVDTDDKVLTLTDGVLSSTLNLTIDTEADAEGKKYIRLTGKNSENLGKIDIADFVVDGMLVSVEEKENDPTTLVFTWNEASGKTTTTEINFGKYVDTYAADGSTLELDSNTKTFSVKENVFVKTDGYVAYSDAEKTKLASIAENAQVNTIESITLNNEALEVDSDKNINIDLSAYALNASVNESLDLKANAADVYDTSTIDTLLGAKLDASDYETKVEAIDGSITTINTELAKKADASTVDEALAGKVDVSTGYSLVENGLIAKLDAMPEIKSVSGDLTLTDGVLSVDLSSKLDANATINGVGFSNGAATINASDIVLGAAITPSVVNGGAYTTENTIQEVLESLSSRIDVLDPTITGEYGVSEVKGGNGIEVTGAITTPSIAVKRSDKADNMVSVDTSGVYVPDMRSYWEAI